jgi:DeoR family transcriptional regulator, fructose operon transcriptional repressor
VVAERQEEIRLLLQERGNITVVDLAQHFSVSEMTIRRDLKALAALGLVQREHGRAVYFESQEPAFFARLGECEREKLAIGRLAASLVNPGESIILDAGTTTLAVAQVLTQKCVVITNSLPIAGVLGNRPDITTIISGGEVRGSTYALVGPMVRNSLQGFNADKLFLGATGISLERGLSTENMLESEVKQAMLKAAKQVILLAHSKKVGQVFYHSFAQWNMVQILVTDDGLSGEICAELKSMGVLVLIAQS